MLTYDHLLQELPKFINFLKMMVNKHSYKLSKKEASEMTIKDYIGNNEKLSEYFDLYQKVAKFESAQMRSVSFHKKHYSEHQLIFRSSFLIAHMLMLFTKKLPRKLKSRLVIIECVRYIFWQLFSRKV